MVLDAIMRRRSVRDFKPDPVTDEHIKTLIKAGQFAPTAINSRAVEFMIIKKSETKKALFAILEQDYVHEAPVLIVPVVDTAKSAYPVEDLSAASENIFIQAASMGLGTVWKNVPRNQTEQVRKVLGIPANFLVIDLIPVGMAKKFISPHTDLEFSERKIHYETWRGRA